ncbi:MAG TPA: bifunctional nicotinamidase/pyrazinamidase [Deltaproteobacteria bacterium]|nr:bifunctional nicotinamidase/pyrazinamidase [Deltaproteobacteria bacterium]HOI05978.1 bifunctional nicotinamidase/pyrazinamidase [Deltaproteobacteria bacterium]
MSGDRPVYDEWVRLGRGDALVVVDMQIDFMPGGALAVKDGDAVVAGVNSLMKRFHGAGHPVVLTQDWHAPDHASFASAHTGKNPFEPFEAPGIGPVLWPDHCVQGTPGAEFHKGLKTQYAEAIIRKGLRRDIDSYSGFREHDGKTPTGLDGYLRGRGVERIFLCGLALDYCVFFTAADGADLGYAVYVVMNLTKPVGSPSDSISNALETMTEKGVHFIGSEEIRL